MRITPIEELERIIDMAPIDGVSVQEVLLPEQSMFVDIGSKTYRVTIEEVPE